MKTTNLTPLEVEGKEFSASMRGYNTSEVRAYLERVAQEVESLTRQNRDLQEQLETTREECARMRASEDCIRETLALAQRASEDARQSASREADAILAEARAQREVLLADIERLKAERSAFVVQLKSYLNAFYERIAFTEAAEREVRAG